jgi:tetratricopeptide (TPR) repeat protein
MIRFAGPSLVCLVLTGSLVCHAESTSLQQVRKLIIDGKRDQAIALLRDMIKARPDSYEARTLLGTTLAIEGSRSEAIQQITEAVQLRPKSAAAYNTLGTTLSRFMETADAKKAFEKAIQLNPRFAEAHVNLALVLAQESNWESAGYHIDRALALQPNKPAAAYSHYIRATIWTMQTQFGKADRELEQAVRLRPNFAEAWSDLGWARRMVGDDKGALAAFEKAVVLNSNDGQAQYRLGTAYLREGRADEAIPHLKEALTLNGPDKPTLYNLELALRKAGREEEARAVGVQRQSQVQTSRRSSETSFQVGALDADGIQLEKQGDVRGAVAKYRAALELDPTASGVRLNYGLALCRLKQWQPGIAEIQEVLRVDPDNAAASRALYIAKEQAEAESKAVKP